MSLHVTSDFDGGNIRVVRTAGDRADLEIVADAHCACYQWFNFRVAGASGRELALRITNCAGSSYPEGWPGYQARVSEDGLDWRCAATDYADGVLTIRARPAGDLLQVAYFAPYPLERHGALLDRLGAMPGVSRRVLGQTLEGRPIEALTLGRGAAQVWLIARQHPGETMAGWWIEGALEKLVQADDLAARQLRDWATFHVVANMNPDGSARGHLRTNAAGVNLNREWQSPSLGRSPEVLHVRDAMDATGVDFAIDAHGHEVATTAFAAGPEDIAGWGARRAGLYLRFCTRLAARNPGFRPTPGGTPPGMSLSMAAPQLAQRFGAMAMVLEMPFKDCCAAPDHERGWSPQRSSQLAQDCLDVLAELVDQS